jgi:hypothetical protein
VEICAVECAAASSNKMRGGLKQENQKRPQEAKMRGVRKKKEPQADTRLGFLSSLNLGL